MKITRIVLLLIFFVQFVAPSSTFAQRKISGFVTPRDLLIGVNSNLNLHNNRTSATTAYGLYVRQYAYVAPGGSCDNATVIYPATQNLTAGAFLTPTMIMPHTSAAIGSNYLYNMIYQAIYYENIFIPSSPPGCALPGCSWGTDTAVFNWCIYLGALAPVSTSTGYTANVPPSTDAASSGSYDYNLVTNYVYLGPISCNDQTLTCTTANQQTQSFS